MAKIKTTRVKLSAKAKAMLAQQGPLDKDQTKAKLEQLAVVNNFYVEGGKVK